jgi:hypothetical protein
MKFLLSYSLIIAIILVFSCGEKSLPLPEKDQSAIQSVLEENERIHTFMLKTDGRLPSLVGLQKALEVLTQSDREEISSLAKKMNLNLNGIQGKDLEEDISYFSSYSENLTEFITKYSIPNNYTFYCPMVKKYWVAKGRMVQNPYSSEMRDCGNIVETN